MTRINKAFWISSGLLALALGAWTLHARAGERTEAVSVESPVPIVAPGIVESTSETIALGFELSGRVVELLVDEGYRVKKGQVLARLDDRLARARVAKADAALAAARARRDQAFHGARPEEIRAVESELRAAEAMAEDRARAMSRAQKLLESETITVAEADSAHDAAMAARATADATASRLALLRKGERTEVRREAQAAVLVAEAELDEARTYLDQMELRAPRDGVILRRLIEQGETVTSTPATTVLTMADLDQLQVRTEVDESDVGQVTVGQVGIATAEAFGDKQFTGRVVRITGELGRKTVRLDDPRARIDTRVLEVIVALDEKAQLPLGLRMDMRFEPAPQKQVAENQ